MERNYTTNYLFISNFKFSVNFFSIDLQQLCFNMWYLGHKKTLFIKQEWSSTVTE